MSSVHFQSLDLRKAAWMSPCIVVGTVLEIGSYRFPGSKDHAAQPEGESLPFIRIQHVKTVKEGVAELLSGMELQLFDPGPWFQHTHAAQIRGGVISYAEFHYSGGLSGDGLRVGTTAVFFLSEEWRPAGFPSGSVLLRFSGAYDRADREAEVVAALQEGRPEAFDNVVRISKGDRVRFPDGLGVQYLSHSHKRPRTGGPRKEWINLELSVGGKTETLDLDHCTDPDGKETWESKAWGPYTLEAKDMNTQQVVVIVRKA